MQKLIAFHGKQEVKDFYLARLRAHRAADDIVRTELGIPQMLAHLEDRLFESMSLEHAPDWRIRFIEVIPVGADLSLVPWQLLAFGIERMLPYAAAHPQAEMAVRRVLDEVLHPLAHGDEIADTVAADAARAAAYAYSDAADADADTAADAAEVARAAAAAAATADTAADSARAAADTAADVAADEMDAWADELLRLLANAPVVA